MKARVQTAVAVVGVFALLLVFQLAGTSNSLASSAIDLGSEQKGQEIFKSLGGADGSKPVVMFVTSWCPVCTALEKTLTEKKLPYLKVDIEKNIKAQSIFLQLSQLSPNRSLGVPQTLVGSKVYAGYQPMRILRASDKLESNSIGNFSGDGGVNFGI